MCRFAVATVLLALAGSAGCGGGDPLGGLLAHQEAVVGIIEAHAADPGAAGKAASAYLTEHAAELGQLETAARELERELAGDPNAVAELALAHQEALRRVGERTLALRKETALIADPQVRAALDRFQHP